MNYIGCDCHISSMDCAVVNESGHETKKQKVNTGVKGLMEFVGSIPKPRTIIVEEGSRAGWLLEICTAYGENEGGANNWGEVNKITASDAAVYDNFGRTVSISGDTVVVGAYQDDDNGYSSGSAFFLSRICVVWHRFIH